MKRTLRVQPGAHPNLYLRAAIPRPYFPLNAALAARGAPNPSNIPSVGAVRMINRRNLKGKQEVVKTCSWNVIYGGVL